MSKIIGNPSDLTVASRISRRSALKATIGAIAAPAALYATPVNAQSRTIKIGHVSPRTGPLVGFGEADTFILEQVRGLLHNGLAVGGRTYPVQIISKDSQSSGSRASEVASELILGDKVDLIVASATPDTTNPVADQAEVNEVPCITTNCPWQPYFFGRKGDPAKGFTWTYHFFWGLEDVIASFLALWDSAQTNKVVGGLFPNDADGNAWGDPQRGLPPALAAAGYKLTDPGRYQLMNNDFTSQISAFKAVGAEIVTGNMIPPDFATFWSQAAQQGFRPKIVTIGKALLFPSVIDSLGARGNGLTTEILVDPEPSVQVGPHRPEREGAYRRLCQGDQPALDATDRVPARAVRGGDRRAQAHQDARAEGDPRVHYRDRLPVDGRPREVDRPAGQERHQDTAGRRPMAAQGRQVRARHHHQQAGAADSGGRAAAAVVVSAARSRRFVAATPMTTILALEKISKRFGAVVVASEIDVALSEREALGIIGPNGAGKTTLFGIATGTVAPDGGRVIFAGADITRIAPERRCRLGMARTFQIPQPFGGMTVFENVVVAAAFGGGRRERDTYGHCVDVLAQCGLAQKANRPAGALTLLDRKRLELARALATNPRVLLLDEVAGGLTEHECAALVALIKEVRRGGVSIIWIEHVVHALVATVDRLLVLHGGGFIAQGEPETVIRSPAVREIYMGIPADA